MKGPHTVANGLRVAVETERIVLYYPVRRERRAGCSPFRFDESLPHQERLLKLFEVRVVGVLEMGLAMKEIVGSPPS
jgi:hypothetical protein